MLPEHVAEIVGSLPYMRPKQARVIYDLFVRNDCRRILELGFYHGVSTCYMAGALQDLGGDRTVTTIDRVSAREREPNVEELIAKCGLEDHVEILYEPRSYNWRLMKFIEEGRRFDFSYIDGGHNWYDTGYAFFLVDKLLEPGGLILFDDLYWTAEKLPAAENWPEEERTTQGVLKVWDLLVLQHERYEKVWIKNGWGLARKRASQATERPNLATRVLERFGR